MRIAALLLACASVALAQVPVSGRVVDDIEELPVENARVAVADAETETRTDSDGRFKLTLPDGTHKLTIASLGFEAKTMDLAANAAGELTVVLIRRRSIAARILWPGGDPLEGAKVDLYDAGSNAEVTHGYTDTSGDVQFEVGPGRYYLIISEKSILDRAPKGREASELRYPQLADRGRAIDVRDRASMDLSNLFLAESKGVSVEGRIEVSKDIPITSYVTQVWLIKVAGGGRVAIGNQFRFNNIASGTYYLFARVLTKDQELMLGVQELEVGRAPIRDWVLKLDRWPPLVSFRVEIETKDGVAAPATDVRIQLGSLPFSWGSAKGIDADGKLEIFAPEGDATVLNREWELRILDAPKDAYTASVSQGGVTQSNPPFQIRANAGTIRILLRRDAGKVTGIAPLPEDPPQFAYAVLRARDQPKATLREVRTNVFGEFRFENVTPGDYELIVFDSKGANEQVFLKYRSRAASVTVRPNGEVNVSTQLVRIEP